ncbi:MAG: HNH endonuclease signature motif containing protein [Microgenomates group bacterium]|jgi:hypothetical protein
MRQRKWTELELKGAVIQSRSIRNVLIILGLKPAGGNYKQIKKHLINLKINVDHFTGKGWNKGFSGRYLPRIPLKNILVANSDFQSYKLKRRLFQTNLKKEECEECGWAECSIDGRIPLELDHINGISQDNRLENLRILCPNCHSLKTTHRGRNRKSY